MKTIIYSSAAFFLFQFGFVQNAIAQIHPCTLLSDDDAAQVLGEPVKRSNDKNSNSNSCFYRPVDFLNAKSGVLSIGVAHIESKDKLKPNETEAEFVERQVAALKPILQLEKEEGLSLPAFWEDKVGQMMIFKGKQIYSVTLTCSDKTQARTIARKAAKAVIEHL